MAYLLNVCSPSKVLCSAWPLAVMGGSTWLIPSLDIGMSDNCLLGCLSQTVTHEMDLSILLLSFLGM